MRRPMIATQMQMVYPVFVHASVAALAVQLNDGLAACCLWRSLENLPEHAAIWSAGISCISVKSQYTMQLCMYNMKHGSEPAAGPASCANTQCSVLPMWIWVCMYNNQGLALVCSLIMQRSVISSNASRTGQPTPCQSCVHKGAEWPK